MGDADVADRTNLGEGRYANYAEIGHSAYEFVFDFGQGWLDTEPARIYIRVITSPETAQRIFHALEDALTEYRKTFADVHHD
jgi:hypothetical protein